jgi:hypothetical protein
MQVHAVQEEGVNENPQEKENPPLLVPGKVPREPQARGDDGEQRAQVLLAVREEPVVRIPGRCPEGGRHVKVRIAVPGKKKNLKKAQMTWGRYCMKCGRKFRR